jgi:hypothetical protein
LDTHFSCNLLILSNFINNINVGTVVARYISEGGERRTKGGNMTINVYSTKRFGLEVYQVVVNGVVAHEYLSRQMAMTAFYTLKQRYANLTK